MSPSNALQAFFVQTLLNDAAVSAFVGDRVWDDIPNNLQYPFCSIGPHYYRGFAAECVQGRKHYFQIDCWTDTQGRKDQVNDLTDAIAEALDGATGDLGPHALALCEVVLVRVLDDKDGRKHGVVQVLATVENG